MSTDLARVSTDLAESRRTIASALQFVASIGTTDEAREAYDRTKLAKEWAKIRKVHKEVAADLLRLEIHCLRKIAQLGSTSVLPPAHRGSADFFADKSDADIEALIASYGENATPTSVFRRHREHTDYEAARLRTLAESTGPFRPAEKTYSDEEVAEAAGRYHNDVKGALASIVADYGNADEEFSIHEMAEQVAIAVGIDERNATWGAREGLLEVCRKAVREGPDVTIAGTRAPKFVTCLRRSGETQDDEYIRVPFHAATMQQLADMIALREAQAAAAASVVTELKFLAQDLEQGIDSADGSHWRYDVTLGELAARLALSNPRDVRVREKSPVASVPLPPSRLAARRRSA